MPIRVIKIRVMAIQKYDMVRVLLCRLQRLWKIFDVSEAVLKTSHELTHNSSDKYRLPSRER